MFQRGVICVVAALPKPYGKWRRRAPQDADGGRSWLTEVEILPLVGGGGGAAEARWGTLLGAQVVNCHLPAGARMDWADDGMEECEGGEEWRNATKRLFLDVQGECGRRRGHAVTAVCF